MVRRSCCWNALYEPEKVATREDIKRFASEFDLQAFHLDEAAAEGTTFKGLAASGWHTAAIAMRLAVEVRAFGPHPYCYGVDELRWLARFALATSSTLNQRHSGLIIGRSWRAGSPVIASALSPIWEGDKQHLRRLQDAIPKAAK